MALDSFQGLRVLALESRRATEIAKLIRTYGGEPTVAPAMREVPLESNQEALEFCERLLRGEFDLVIFLTGVGVRRLMEIAETRYPREKIVEALQQVKVVARGPKSTTALRELAVSPTVTAPEPCTWHEVVGALDGAAGASLKGLRAAVQEYGASNPELLQALSERGMQWTRVPVYHWALPEDLGPLREAVGSIVAGHVDVVVFLTAIQAAHLFEIAEQMRLSDRLREGLRRTVVLSIGPTTSEELGRHGIKPDLEPSHPKMGILINEAAGRARKLLEAKRGGGC